MDWKDLITIIYYIISTICLIIGLILAYETIKKNQEIAKKQQTAEFLFHSREDPKYISAIYTLKNVHNSSRSIRSLVIPPTDMLNKEEIKKNEMDYKCIRYILNFYERMAVGVKHGIYDDDMLKEVSYTSVVTSFQHAEELIKAVREKNNNSNKTAYQEFETLVKRWKSNPLKHSVNNS